jgi:hypothetical protein
MKLPKYKIQRTLSRDCVIGFQSISHTSTLPVSYDVNINLLLSSLNRKTQG